MKTTTTTRAAIFAAAHIATRAVRAEYPAADYRATFAAAMRECYAAAADAETVSAESIAAAVMTAPSPRETFAALTDSERVDMVSRMVWHCARTDIAETDKQGNYRPNYFYWIHSADDVAQCVNEAFAWTLDRAFETAEKRDTMPTLKSIIANACRNAARRIARNEIKHANAIRIESKTDEDGKEYLREYVKDAATCERIAPNPEDAMLIADSIDRACRDDIDRTIVKYLAMRYSMRWISALVGISQPAISKRVKAIRERYRAIDAETAEMDNAVTAYRIAKRIKNASRETA